MDFKKIIERGTAIDKKYNILNMKKRGIGWTDAQVMEGFVGDVGDLMKLVMAKSGIRDIENVDREIAHELVDCLWSIIVLANRFEVDLEKEFFSTMDFLENKIDDKLEEK